MASFSAPPFLKLCSAASHIPVPREFQLETRRSSWGELILSAIATILRQRLYASRCFRFFYQPIQNRMINRKEPASGIVRISIRS